MMKFFVRDCIRLSTNLSLLFLFLSATSLAEYVDFGQGANRFSIRFVPIDNPGNPSDTLDGYSVGAVNYSYRIAKYEVSRDMIIKTNAMTGLGITLADMKDYGGNGLNKPATGISWNEAARFVNFLNTDSGGHAAYKFTSGSISANISRWEAQADPLDYNPNNPFRSIRANYVIPNIDEWHKAAYFDALMNEYYNYPTGTNDIPMPVVSGTAAGTAVYLGQVGPADIDQAGGLSPYGVMGMGGNAFEWEETTGNRLNSIGSDHRGTRGGDFWERHAGAQYLSSASRPGISPDVEAFNLGFRVASVSSVPEPNSIALVITSATAMFLKRRMSSGRKAKLVEDSNSINP